MKDLIVGFLASFLIWFMYAGLLVLWFIDGRIKKEQVLHALFSSFFAWFVIAEILKKLIPSVRPFVLNGHTPLTLTMPNIESGAFPSGHSAGAFALATTIWLHDRKVGWLYIFLAFIVGTARVLANVHYPIDVLGGALVGVITSFATEKAHLFSLLSSLRRRIKV